MKQDQLRQLPSIDVLLQDHTLQVSYKVGLGSQSNRVCNRLARLGERISVRDLGLIEAHQERLDKARGHKPRVYFSHHSGTASLTSIRRDFDQV